MLTALHIEKYQHNNALFRFLNRLCPNSLKTEIKEVNKSKIKIIEYRCRNNKVNWQKIDKEVSAQRNRLLCSSELELPKKCGYKRFDETEYKQRLCTNVAVSLLCSIKNADFKVGLVDKDAQHTALIGYILKYADNLVVVTDRVDEYQSISHNQLMETGVSVRLTKSEKAVKDCDLLISPCTTDYSHFAKDDALVLSCVKPLTNQQSTVVYDYTVNLPKSVEDLCPLWLDKMYFASALYTQLHIYQLGSLVPSLCVSNKEVQTLSSLKAILMNQNDKT